MINYILVGSVSILLIFAFFSFRGHKDQLFIKLAILFIFLFFLMPFYMLLYWKTLPYGPNIVSISEAGISRAAVGLAVFVAAFFSFDIKNHFRAKQASSGTNHAVKPTAESRMRDPQLQNSEDLDSQRVFVIFALGISMFVLNQFLSPESEALYDIRRGQSEGNHFVFLVSIISTTLMLSAFFLCIKARWAFFAFVAIALIIASYLLASPGRTAFSLALILLFIFATKINVQILVNVLPIIILFLFPLIVNGKEIIYNIVLLNNFGIIVDAYDFVGLPEGRIFNNFAHPFVSMIYADDLLDLIGYRGFYDYLHGFLFYARAFGVDLGDSLTYYNTEIVLGIDESIIPPGYLAFGYVQFSYIGVAVAGVFFRYTYRVFSATALYKIAFGKELAFYGAFLSANTFYTGDIRQLVITFLLVVLTMHVVGVWVSKNSTLSFDFSAY